MTAKPITIGELLAEILAHTRDAGSPAERRLIRIALLCGAALADPAGLAPSSLPAMPDALIAEHMERGHLIARLADEVLERRAEQRLLALVETAARAVLGAPELRVGGSAVAARDGLYDAIEELDKHRAAKAPPVKP